MTRLKALSDRRFDVAVIGAGATGAGIARDAALRGLSVLLLDRGDVAAGTSSGSSRLIHGGLRYLLQGQLELVRECLEERNTLMRLAPHLVRPATFLMALYRGAVRERWPLYWGLRLARYLARNPAEPHIAQIATEPLLAEVPALKRDGLRGGLRFHDAITNDARLCLEVTLGARDAGAEVATYVEVLSVDAALGRPARLRLRDARTGDEDEVASDVVVQAAGAWTGTLDIGSGTAGDAAISVEPARGSHLALPACVPADTVVAAPHPKDGRFTFAIGFDSHTWLGTTDVEHAIGPDRTFATGEEIAYLDAWLRAYMPSLAGRAWLARAALRPLVGGLGRSRDFRCAFTDRGVLAVAGGKITTHRSMAAVVVDKLLTAPAFAGRPVGSCRTAEVPLPGAPPLPLAAWLTEEIGGKLVDDAVRRHLLLRYGGRAEALFLRIARDPALGARLHPERNDVLAEVDFAVDEELACSLSDVMWRRIGIAFSSDGGAAAVAAATERLAARLGWDAAEATRQRDAFERERAAARRAIAAAPSSEGAAPNTAVRGAAE